MLAAFAPTTNRSTEPASSVLALTRGDRIQKQIIGILREYEAGAKLSELCRRHNVSQTTIYKWRAKFGGMTVSDAKRLKGLEDKNRRLKGLLAKNW